LPCAGRQSTRPAAASDDTAAQLCSRACLDATRDAAADVQAAILEAQKTGKRILLDVGGEWCPWCHVLDEFFHQHPDVLELRDVNFVVVNVYYGSDRNEKVLSHYSKVLGIPHFFVWDKDGTFAALPACS